MRICIFSVSRSAAIKESVDNCPALERPDLMTATNMRHFVSTAMEKEKMTENEKKAFYKHMGHSERISQGTYQCPPGLTAVTRIGRILHKLDQGPSTTPANFDMEIENDAAQPQEIEDTVSNIQIEALIREHEEVQEQIAENPDPIQARSDKKKRITKKWTTEEESELHRFFKVNYAMLNKIPRKAETEDFLRGVGWNRPWEHVRDKVRNDINKRKELLAKANKSK